MRLYNLPLGQSPWSDVGVAPALFRVREAVAYDAARQQLVLFGGALGLQARWGDDRLPR
jgi:hypothetical protein